MGFSFKKVFQNAVKQEVMSILKGALVELDPKKRYILILPDNMDYEQTVNALRQVSGDLNFVVLFANNVRLMEVS